MSSASARQEIHLQALSCDTLPGYFRAGAEAPEQALGGAGVDTSGLEITDVAYDANTGWTGAYSNEFGTWNQNGQYSTTVIPDDGDQSTTWPAVQEVATGVKTTVSDIWTSIFGGEKPAEQPGQQEVVTEGTGPNNGEPAKEEQPTDEQATERQMPPQRKDQIPGITTRIPMDQAINTG